MRRFLYELTEALRIAFTQIHANKMRSALTALGVVIGIVAVTLMGTAINGIDAGVDRSFAGFGDDVLYVCQWPWRDVDDWWVYRNRRSIKIPDAAHVSEWIDAHPGGPLQIVVPVVRRRSTITRGESRVTNIMTFGTSADFPRISRSDLSEGRFFSEFEAQNGRSVAVVGYDVAEALFPENPRSATR